MVTLSWDPARTDGVSETSSPTQASRGPTCLWTPPVRTGSQKQAVQPKPAEAQLIFGPRPYGRGPRNKQPNPSQPRPNLSLDPTRTDGVPETSSRVWPSPRPGLAQRLHRSQIQAKPRPAEAQPSPSSPAQPSPSPGPAQPAQPSTAPAQTTSAASPAQPSQPSPSPSPAPGQPQQGSSCETNLCVLFFGATNKNDVCACVFKC